jgi:hypothetical protein
VNQVCAPRATGQSSRMDAENPPPADDSVERELQAILAEEAERRRPDRRPPRGNQAVEPLAVERGRESLERVL